MSWNTVTQYRVSRLSSLLVFLLPVQCEGLCEVDLFQEHLDLFGSGWPNPAARAVPCGHLR